MIRGIIAAFAIWICTHSMAWAEDLMTLQFNPKTYDMGKIQKVVVRGTFTSWMKSSWSLQQGDDKIWRLTRPTRDFAIPGNSGQPEYKFVVNDQIWVGAEREAPGYQFTGNFVILFPGDDPADIARRDELATLVRETYESDEQLGNFRELSGGQLAPRQLFRSYHPFIPSRSELKSEGPRLQAVQHLMERNGINAVINLSDHTGDVRGKASPYYEHLFENQNVLLHITSYEDSFFNPEGSAYAYTLQRVFQFIASHHGPYLIHCRLGTDRTGVMSAVLEAFMGVPWPTIARDFEKSSELGIREYRHSNLLAYGFQRMLGQKPEQIEDLAQAMRTFLLQQGISSATLDTVAAQLSDR